MRLLYRNSGYSPARLTVGRLFFWSTALCFFALYSAPRPAAQPRQAVTLEAVSDELLIQFKPGVREKRRAAARAAHGARLVRRFDALHIERLKLPHGAQRAAVERALRMNHDVWAV